MSKSKRAAATECRKGHPYPPGQRRCLICRQAEYDKRIVEIRNFRPPVKEKPPKPVVEPGLTDAYYEYGREIAARRRAERQVLIRTEMDRLKPFIEADAASLSVRANPFHDVRRWAGQ